MPAFTVLNPATEEPVAEVEQTSAAAADEAIARAVAVQPAWRKVAPGERAALLRAFADVIDAHIGELAELETAGSGHPAGQARWEAGNVRDVLRYYSAAPERLCGKQIPVPGGLDVTFHEPVGVVGVIVPWNFPMPILGWGAAPALAAGNPVIAKPAERTPLTAVRIAELALEAGLPEGVFQVLAGKGSVVGQRLVDHPDVRKIVFTGSSEVGREIMAGCARQVKRVTMELGGKSANIVFADADLEKAAATAPVAAFDNAGQDCCARSRILVQREVYDRFLELLEPAVKAVAVGDPADDDTEMGPLISAEHRDRVASYVPAGAPVAFRGSAPEGPGYWYPPTVLAPVRLDDPAYTEEVFGPVTRPMACPARCGPATWAGPSGWREQWRPATCRSTPTPRSATGPRSAASSSPGSGASWDRMPSMRSPRPRTSSSRRMNDLGGVAGPELTLHDEEPGPAGHRGPGEARGL
jgi:acyl-CoA reductase-like NAD-dependent aldehyde dehydrogenase